jgi:hypothetical protein
VGINGTRVGAHDAGDMADVELGQPASVPAPASEVAQPVVPAKKAPAKKIPTAKRPAKKAAPKAGPVD